MQRPVPLSLSPLLCPLPSLFSNRTRIYVGARTALILTLILALIYPWSGYAFACIKPYTMRLYQHGRGAVSRSLCAVWIQYQGITYVWYIGWARNIWCIFVFISNFWNFNSVVKSCLCDIWKKILGLFVWLNICIFNIRIIIWLILSGWMSECMSFLYVWQSWRMFVENERENLISIQC